MHSLTAITALGETSTHIDTFDGLTIAECPDWSLASLATRNGMEKKLATAASKFLGTALPAAAQCARGGSFTVFWTGPEQWMIEAPHDSHDDLAAQVKAAVTDSGSVTEQTDGWVRFDLEGPRCADVLERLCNANSRKMPSDSVTRTRLEHLGCFLICRTANTHFSVIGPRSSARSLHHALVTAAKSAI